MVILEDGLFENFVELADCELAGDDFELVLHELEHVQGKGGVEVLAVAVEVGVSSVNFLVDLFSEFFVDAFDPFSQFSFEDVDVDWDVLLKLVLYIQNLIILILLNSQMLHHFLRRLHKLQTRQQQPMVILNMHIHMRHIPLNPLPNSIPKYSIVQILYLPIRWKYHP